MKTKTLALSTLSLTLFFASLFPISAQAADGCDIFANPSCTYEVDDGYMALTGKLYDLSPSITLSTPQSVVEFRLVAPSSAQLSQWNLDEQRTSISCSANSSTRFLVAHSTSSGVSSEVVFQGQSQTATSSITPYGEHSLVIISFLVPQTATLAPYSCNATIGNWSGGAGLSGDGYMFTFNLNRTFTPSTPTPTASTPTPTPTASTRSTPTPSASASPRGTSSPSPAASAESTDEEGEVETRASEVVVGGHTESASEASPIGFFLAGILSTLAGVGATVAFFQRKAIMKAITKFKKIAKP